MTKKLLIIMLIGVFIGELPRIFGLLILKILL